MIPETRLQRLKLKARFERHKIKIGFNATNRVPEVTKCFEYRMNHDLKATNEHIEIYVKISMYAFTIDLYWRI